MGPLPPRASVRDVGPRDGLQPEAPVTVDERIALVHALVDAGLRAVEVAAFVSPKAVPAMAGGAEVLAGVERRPGVTYAALVPNVRGAEMAVEADADLLTFTVSASPTYNRRNVRMEVEESLALVPNIIEAAGATTKERPVDVVISCAFGSPYEGEISPTGVADLVRRVADDGALFTLADTTGMATPRRIHDVLDALGDELVGGVGLHLHDTRGTALLNAHTALERGAARFDTAVGGLGGSPFAHGAGGNLATEELVALLDDLGVETGIDVEGLVAAAALVERLVGRPVPSGVAHAGPRTRRATGT